jgi:hypothetical protein
MMEGFEEDSLYARLVDSALSGMGEALTIPFGIDRNIALKRVALLMEAADFVRGMATISQDARLYPAHAES